MKKKWIITGALATVAVATFIWAPRFALVAMGAGLVGWIGRELYNQYRK